MDQLFVNERLPSPSPPGSTHSQEEEHEENSWRDAESSSSIARGKGPELPTPVEEDGGSSSRHRDQSLSALEGTIDIASTQSRRTTQENDDDDEPRESFLDRYRDEDTSDGSRRPALLNRRSSGQASQRSHASLGTGVVSVNEASAMRSYSSTPRRRSPSNLEIYGDGEGSEGNRNRSTSSAQRGHDIMTGENSRPPVPRRYSRPTRPYSYAGGGSGFTDPLAGMPATVPALGLWAGQLPDGRGSSPETVVPRWQPDGEVTFCPICKTQFSFFVRKHHCRKCGRVVCNSCSPHRITIPHQYIVQPPTEAPLSTTRPAVDASRARSQTIVEGLGGGERVRLCNPCVPDPNIAPPQTRSDGQPIQGHSRSQSTVPFSPSRRGDMDIPTYRSRPREASLTAEARQNRYWAGNQQPGQQNSTSFNPRSDSLPRSDALEVRSRSSTVGSTREGSQNISGARPDGGTYSRPYQVSSRPLPNTPQREQRTMQRRQIREDDLCWLCGQELPSRNLPDFEDLRSAHVIACLEAATLRASGSPTRTITSSPAPPPPTPPPPSQSHPAQRQSFSYASIDPRLLHTSTSSSISAATSTVPPSSSSSAARPPPPPPAPSAPPLSTPEARMQARERQHAAVVLGLAASMSGPSSASAMTRVIPYFATEKDGIDDAECMICMEDFEVGQEMGRLECFCRFHLKCIRGWFEKKPGKCPVHGGDFF